MVNLVKKRDGRVEPFECSHITIAIQKAAKSVNEELPDKFYEEVCSLISNQNKTKIGVEEIQDIIEKHLMDNKHYEVAKNFILYREKHKEIRSILEKEEFMKFYIQSSNAASGSKYDSNANVTEKNIATLNGEIPKLDYLRLNRKRVMDKLRELYPGFNVKQYEKDLESHILYKHDESSSPGIYPYCVAVSMWPFLNDGLKNIGGLSAAPKNIDSFCGMFLHLVFALASQFAGAVAFGEFFNCFDYYARKEWGDHYYKHDNLAAHLKYRKNASGEYETYEISISKQIEQYFQQIVYGLNQPAGNRSYQSPFTNFSYYDKNYWEALFADFCYPDGTKPQWESVSYLQKKFMKWFNQERTKTVLTFPVETMALLSDGKNRILDEEYEKFTAEMYAEGHSFFTYISDNPNGLSSCCFSGEEEIEVYVDGGPKKMTIQEYVDSIDSKVDPKGFDVVNGDRILSYSIEDGSNEEVNITGILKKKYSGTMYRIGVNSKYITVTGDHPLMVSDIHSNRVLKVLAQDFDFDNHLVALESSNGVDFCKASTYEKEEVENKIVYDIQLEKNHFFSANGIITHNCRLRNEVEENEFSFTNGLSGVATGSKSVITLNLNRIVQNYAKSKSKDKGEFKEYLIKILDRVYKYHHAYNELLKDLQASNMLPVYDAGFISLNQQFLTIGINGMNEAAEFLGLECSDNPEYQAFVDSVCSTISEQNKLHKTKDMKFNQEYVPAENLGVKNYRWDKEAGYKVPKDRNAYNSYFYLPDNEDTEILERFRLQGRRYTQNLDGGVALHCNLQEHLSEEQYLKLMRYAVQEGCSFFTFNVKNSICNDCGYISKHTIDKCPHCGSTNIDWITRIIGYLKRIANFSEARQQEASRRVYK